MKSGRLEVYMTWFPFATKWQRPLQRTHLLSVYFLRISENIRLNEKESHPYFVKGASPVWARAIFWDTDIVEESWRIRVVPEVLKLFLTRQAS